MARAKRTARAEARRRYRAEHPLQPGETEADDGDGELEDAPPPTRRGASGRAAETQDRPARPSGPRPSALRAFRDAYQPADIRGDLRALPELLRSRAVVLPALLIALSSVIYAVAIGTTAGSGLTGPSTSPVATLVASASPAASALGSPGASAAVSGTGDSATGSMLGVIASILALLFLEIPPIGGIYLAAILAKRSSYIAGAIAGFLGPLGLVLAVLAVATDRSVITLPLVVQILAESTIFGLLIGAGLGYYRRLLRLMNPTPNRPNRAKPAARRR